MRRIVKLILFVFMVLLPFQALAVDTSGDSPPALPALTKKERQAIRDNNAVTGGKTTDPGQNPTDPANPTVNDPEPVDPASNETTKIYNEKVTKTVASLGLLSKKIKNKSTGIKIKVIAQAQSQSANIVNEAIIKVDNRHRILKFLVGPDYKSLKIMRQEIEKNNVRINNLETVLNSSDMTKANKAELQNEIYELKEQNTILSSELGQRTKPFSLLGWFFKWYHKY